MATMKDGKPWYRSLTVAGVVTATLGFLSAPEVFGILPVTVAKAVGVLGAAAAVLGLRRATPPTLYTSPTITPLDHRQWEMTFDASGFNPYGETMDQVLARQQLMTDTARAANLHTVPGPQGPRMPGPGAGGYPGGGL